MLLHSGMLASASRSEVKVILSSLKNGLNLSHLSPVDKDGNAVPPELKQTIKVLALLNLFSWRKSLINNDVSKCLTFFLSACFVYSFP